MNTIRQASGHVRKLDPTASLQRLATACAVLQLADPPVSRAAVRLAVEGFHVLPVRDKKPLVRRGVHAATRCPTTIRGWFTHWPGAGLAVACGPSGVVVVDIDLPAGPASLDALEAEHGPLPATVTVQTPSGGVHHYFRAPAGVDLGPSVGKLGRGIDIRAAAAYVVAPPSAGYHVDDPDHELPTFDAMAPLPGWLVEKLGISSPADGTHKAHKAQYMIDASASEGDVAGDKLGISSGADDLPSQAQALIARTLPKSPGTRNRRIFDIVCGMKADPELRALSRADRKRIIRRWYELALPVITTKDYAVTLSDFDHAWAAFDPARAGGGLADVVAAAKSSDPVPGVDPHYPERVHLLAKLCRELARRADDRSFFLAARAIERHMGTPSMTASRDMKLLIADGLISVSTPAGFEHGRRTATHYVYHGG